MTIHKSVSELIGNTPLIELTNFEKNHDLGATILGKVELFNPAGSVKDRIAKAMIDEAVKAGKVNDDTVLIEPTSPYHHDAGDDVDRASQPYESLWRRSSFDRRLKGHEGGYREGSGARRRDFQLIHPKPVHQSGESGYPRGDDWP